MSTNSPPTSVRLAAVLIGGEVSLLFILGPMSLTRALLLLLGLLFSWLLFRGSGVIFALTLIGSVAQLIGSAVYVQPMVVGISLLTLVCLALPSSRNFARQKWREDVRRQPLRCIEADEHATLWSLSDRIQSSLMNIPFSLMNPPRGYGRLIIRLIIVLVILYLCVGVTALWAESSGRGSVPVEVLQHVAWVAYASTQLLLIFVVILACWHFLHRKPKREQESPTAGHD